MNLAERPSWIHFAGDTRDRSSQFKACILYLEMDDNDNLVSLSGSVSDDLAAFLAPNDARRVTDRDKPASGGQSIKSTYQHQRF